MKRNRKALWSVLLLTVILTSACSNDPAPGVNEPTEPPPGQTETEPEPEEIPDPEAADEALIESFREVIRQAEGAEDLIAFLDDHLQEASDEAADQMFLELEAYYAEDLPQTQGLFLTNEVQEKFSIMGDPTTSASITDAEIREMAIWAEAGHYVLIQTDGEVYPIIDYPALEKYNPYLTSELSDYLHLKAMDAERQKSGEPDSAGTLGYTADWAVAAERYLDRYPDSHKREEVLENYANRIEFLLFGMAGGPRFDLDNGVIYDEYMEAFQQIAQRHADTFTGSLVQRYVDLLGDSDQKIIIVSATDRRDVPEIAELRDGLTEQIHERYVIEEETEDEPSN
ncbi:hypothetical protein [Paenibacillus daejeonensis]|uniref:hypothetical protein n=1 Tax=Paenibacillus daejeonensis TaxID=135193 RepID=UPI00037542C5|nr:hypothetical protein [Paenibacillus daejeonensis]